MIQAQGRCLKGHTEMRFRTIHIAETDSTNTWLKTHGDGGDVAVWADFQSAGRGCGDNRWESERGKNLLFSVCCHPANVPANRQFLLIEAMALAVKKLLDCFSPGEPLTVKWPNDIYWRDRKLAGTLSECVLNGQHIRSCIIGTGINLNQTEFRSNAPNPVSVAQIRGTSVDVASTLERLLHGFDNELEAIGRGEWDAVHEAYCAALYGRDRFHTYADAGGRFEAIVDGVEPDGHLLLKDRLGRGRRYAFKEVSLVLGEVNT